MGNQTHKTVPELIEVSLSKNTRKARDSDLRAYFKWCVDKQRGTIPSTPEQVAEYAAFMLMIGRKTSTILRAISSISTAHKTRGFNSPCKEDIVRNVLRGIQRENPADKKQALPITPTQLVECIKSQSSTSWPGARNKAILMISWCGALRISETAALRVCDVVSEDEGFVVNIQKSKTDQDREGFKIGIPHSPLSQILETWISRVKMLSDDPKSTLFPRFRKSEIWFPSKKPRAPLSVRGISKIVVDIFSKCGFGDGYSPHSLRAGLITTAAKLGVPERHIQEHSRHRSLLVMRGYIRDASVFLDNPLSPILSSIPALTE